MQQALHYKVKDVNFYQTIRSKPTIYVCVSPLSPNLIQAARDPLLTSWPEASAVGLPRCRSYGASSCTKQRCKEQRDCVTEMMQGGGERLGGGSQEYQKEST